VIQIIGE